MTSYVEMICPFANPHISPLNCVQCAVYSVCSDCVGLLHLPLLLFFIFFLYSTRCSFCLWIALHLCAICTFISLCIAHSQKKRVIQVSCLRNSTGSLMSYQRCHCLSLDNNNDSVLVDLRFAISSILKVSGRFKSTAANFGWLIRNTQSYQRKYILNYTNIELNIQFLKMCTHRI